MSAALTLPYVWATATEALAKEHSESCHDDGLAFYRKRTESLLRRYVRASLAVGRVPSVMDDVTLRGRVSSTRLKNFEDVVIFAIDIEKCLMRLDAQSRQLIAKLAIQEYLVMEIAEQMRQDTRTIVRNYGKALDRLTAEFMKKGLFDEER